MANVGGQRVILWRTLALVQVAAVVAILALALIADRRSSGGADVAPLCGRPGELSRPCGGDTGPPILNAAGALAIAVRLPGGDGTVTLWDNTPSWPSAASALDRAPASAGFTRNWLLLAALNFAAPLLLRANGAGAGRASHWVFLLVGVGALLAANGVWGEYERLLGIATDILTGTAARGCGYAGCPPTVVPGP